MNESSLNTTTRYIKIEKQRNRTSLILFQEEDFVANTYKRTLLSRIPTTDVRELLAHAFGTVASLDTARHSQEVLEAILNRLEIRIRLLEAVQSPQHLKDQEKLREPWQEALLVLPSVEKTHSLGEPVEAAFSVKLQRKLASTMPPRAIAKIEFGEAFKHLSRLFHDGLELADVLKFSDSQSLFVSLRLNIKTTRCLTHARHSCEHSKRRSHSLWYTYAPFYRHISLTPWKCWAP